MLSCFGSRRQSGYHLTKQFQFSNSKLKNFGLDVYDYGSQKKA